MKISLIENGLDSLKKGYGHLKKYEELDADPMNDTQRFSLLKDAILAIQHGVEILFKDILRNKNEILLYSEINAKLKQAFTKRREGVITELFELDGVHTVTFKESLERVRDICGIEIPSKLNKSLIKVEAWRNLLMHSAVSLPEVQVAAVLGGLMHSLDNFFSTAIGERYINGQGRVDLERAYNLYIASRQVPNDLKETVVKRLIAALKEHGVKDVTAPGVFLVKDYDKAIGILSHIQGDDLVYGCDFSNHHCSGLAKVVGAKPGGILRIYTEDIDNYYDIGLDGIVVYVPAIAGDLSPLVFVFSKQISQIGSSPYKRDKDLITIQEGYIHEDGNEIWEADDFKATRSRVYKDDGSASDEGLRKIYRFLGAGCAMFLNVQKLKYGRSVRLMHDPRLQEIQALYNLFNQYVSGHIEE
ncbi:hypothetical protein [Massilia sp. BKSP1R2A-1]|uniref:hypothetical protein n=1 Tax=Massilia sp. BKSP1R2A-1 TaxID=3422595 RepID=UPI003D34DEA6